MQLPLSRAISPGLEFLPRTGSTNEVLVGRASDAPHFAVVVTTDQTAGRGRLGRVWVAPPGKTLAVSVLLRPESPSPDSLGWLPLLAGLAMTRAVSSLVTGHAVTLKWPNDVQVDGLKVSGLLTELAAGGTAVVVGAGLNLTMTEAELPTPVSTSLSLNGVPEESLVDAALASYLTELTHLYAGFAEAGFDASRGLHGQVTAACGSLGKSVRVELPGGSDLFGIAESIDEFGRLVVRDDTTSHAVAAGDVTHLRYA